MKSFSAALVASTALFAAGLAPASAQEAVTLKILHINDLDQMDGTGDAGGPARVATLARELRAAHEHVLVTNGGDAISPSILSGFDGGAHMIELFDMVGFDAMALGNHEFDFGPEVAATRISEADFPILSNNAIEPDGTLMDGVEESLMFEFGGYKVGMFGLTTESTEQKSSPAPVDLINAVEVAEAMSTKLREAGADLVIALAHTDLGEDVELIRAGTVDIVLSGDDHDLRTNYNGDVLLVESGSQAEYATIVTVRMETVEGRRGPRFVWTPSVEQRHTGSVTPAEDIAAAVADYEALLSKELDIDIGTTEVELDSRRSTVRSTETGIANLIVDAMLGASGGDVAITNGGGIRADKIYDAGATLTRRDILSELPFGNKTIVIEVTGAEIVAALENGVSQVEETAGRFPHVAGMSFSFDGSRPAGERVSEVMIGGAPVKLDGKCKLATNDYMGGGGDGYTVFAGAPRLIDENAGELMASQVIRYVEAAGAVSPKVEGRVKRLD